MSDTIVCPSGLSGRIRGMKVKEERVLADRKLARAGGQLEELLRACWLETLEPGPYELGDGPLDWGKVLQGDRFYVLLQIRALTYGPEYAFAVHCEACRARIEWELDLCELPVRPLNEESRAAFGAGNRFEARLPDARVAVWFKLLTGADERRLTHLRRSANDRVLSSLLAYRVLDIEDIEPRGKQAYLEELSMRDADFLVDEFDRVDCGVETAIEIECGECHAIFEVELPFDRSFFLPGKERTARRRGQRGSGQA